MAVPAPLGLWSSVAKLLRLQLRISWNNIRRATRRRKFGYAMLTLLVVGVLVGVFAGSWALLSLISSPEITQYVQPGDLVQNIPVFVLTAAFFILVATSFGVLLQSLYLSGDMEFLLAAPVSIRAVFIAKLVQAILPDFGLVCLFGLPILFGLGVSQRFGFLYYPLVILVLMALALAISGLTSLLVMAVVRVVPARRVAEMLGFLGAIVSVLCSQSGQLAENLRISSGNVSGAYSTLSRLDTPWSPVAWAGHGLLGIAQADWLTGAGLLAAFFLLTAVAFYVALVTAERLYFTGWSRVQAGTRRRKTARQVRQSAAAAPMVTGVKPAAAPARSLGSLLFAWLPRPTRAIIAKDFRILTRDLRSMSQVVTPLLFGIVYAIAISRTDRIGQEINSNPGLALTLRDVTVYGSVAISLFVSWGLLSRLALMSFSHEGRSYWLIKSAPAASRQILAAKFLVAYLPGLALGLLFLAVTSTLQHAGAAVTAYSAVMLLFSLAGAVGVNLAFGVAGVNLTWQGQGQSPRSMLRGTTGCVASLVGMGYLLLIIVVFFGPPVGVKLLGLSEDLGRLVGLALGVTASLLCTLLPPLAVLKRIDRLGED
jgi:ABC-2 type transport system permease protein